MNKNILRWPLALLLVPCGTVFLFATYQLLRHEQLGRDEAWLLTLTAFWLGYLPLRLSWQLFWGEALFPLLSLAEWLLLDLAVCAGAAWAALGGWQQQPQQLGLLLVIPVYLFLRVPVLLGRLRWA